MFKIGCVLRLLFCLLMICCFVLLLRLDPGLGQERVEPDNVG